MPNFLFNRRARTRAVFVTEIIRAPFLLPVLLFLSTEARTQENVANETVQFKLRQAAISLKGYDNGFVVVDRTEVEPGNLVVYYRASRDVDPARALARMRDVDWSKALCADPESADLLKAGAASFTISFETDQATSEQIQHITEASCGASTVAQTPRMINGSPLYPKPTRDSALATISSYLRQALLDFDSAKIECGDVSEATWLKPVFGKRIYGYYLYCQVNAKNAYGGYTGFQGRWFRFNGGEFEEVEQSFNKTGLVDP